MKTLAFQQVDVFTAVPFKGNPVAVVLDGDELSSAQMQSIAAWTNLSETTFVCTPTDQRADYRLRIFTPKRELPFAGHPTIGSAHAVLRHGLKPRVAGSLVQECAKGLADIEVRSFAPGEGVPEDPVCGSGNGCVAALVRRDGALKTQTYVASQGRRLGRDGQVTVEFDGTTIWLGGRAVTCVEGVLQP